MAGALTRWDPFAELAEIRTRLDRVLHEFAEGEHGWTPSIDVLRDDRHLIVRANVPGIKPDEIAIEIDDGMLSLSGGNDETEEKTDEHFVRRERRSGAFSRRISLPEGVNAKKIEATTHDGVLEVTIPLPREPVTITPTTG